MSYLSEKEEDRAFNSLSPKERQKYFENYRESGDVRGSLDTVLGPTWFNPDGSPRGHLHGPNPDEKE